MFVIQTAKPGEAWHTLHPVTRLVHVDSYMGARTELRVAVRLDPGHPEGPYIFKFWLDDAYGGPTVEMITQEEFNRRSALMWEHEGKVYGDAGVQIEEEGSPAWTLAKQVAAHFRELMTSGAFQVPVNY